MLSKAVQIMSLKNTDKNIEPNNIFLLSSFKADVICRIKNNITTADMNCSEVIAENLITSVFSAYLQIYFRIYTNLF